MARRSSAPVVWMTLLLASIFLEGLGRKFVPQIPPMAFYFLKDVVLLAGLVIFGIRRNVISAARWAYGSFALVLLPAVGFTVLQAANPEHGSPLLALLGLRSYWLWWLSPVIIASALRDHDDRERTIAILSKMGIFMVLFAYLQFASPPDAAINAYAWEGATPDIVGTTRRVRVSSTFSYLSGFTNFVVLVPGVLLGLALAQRRRGQRWMGLIAAAMITSAAPLTGSRAAVLLGIGCVAVVAMTSGFLLTRTGRRAFVAVVLALTVTVLAAPEAIEGVQHRFELSDTDSRIVEALAVFPPIALSHYNYPLFGIGTGMQQNARFALGVRAPYNVEAPEGRYLVELGVVGYFLFWLARLGLFVMLARIALRLRRRGWAGASATAFGLALVTIPGNLVFDHVFQSMYFTFVGLVLHVLTLDAEQAAVALRPATRAESAPTHVPSTVGPTVSAP